MAVRGDLDGILNVDKPVGMTSHDIVAAIRRMARAYPGTARLPPGEDLREPRNPRDAYSDAPALPQQQRHTQHEICNTHRASRNTSGGTAEAQQEEPRSRNRIKVGHAGTLDPLATGVLLVCLGRATRASEYLMRSSKVYRGTIHLGVTTTTHDAEGKVTSRSPVDVTRGEVEATLARFVGTIDQLPPRYSAIKHRGKPLYAWAREGVDVEVASRRVEIEAIEIVAWDLPEVTVEVRCGPGTYIRALARDVGQALGCGGYLAALRRTASGAFHVSDAVDLESLREAFATGHVGELLHGIEVAFYDLPVLRLDADQAHRLAMGQFVEHVGALDHDGLVRAHGPDGQFVALAFRDEESGAWRPRKVFVRPEEMAS